MPLPKPKNDEIQKEFISRCMGDKVMTKEFTNSRQRAAICYDIWKKDRSESLSMVFDILKSSRQKKIKV